MSTSSSYFLFLPNLPTCRQKLRLGDPVTSCPNYFLLTEMGLSLFFPEGPKRGLSTLELFIRDVASRWEEDSEVGACGPAGCWWERVTFLTWLLRSSLAAQGRSPLKVQRGGQSHISSVQGTQLRTLSENRLYQSTHPGQVWEGYMSKHSVLKRTLGLGI